MSAPAGTAVMSPAVVATAQPLVADDKGLLARDKSMSTFDERFAAAGIPQTARRGK